MKTTMEKFVRKAADMLVYGALAKNKSEIEVIAAVINREWTIKRLKRHDKAIDNLKSRGILRKDKKNILHLVR